MEIIQLKSRPSSQFQMSKLLLIALVFILSLESATHGRNIYQKNFLSHRVPRSPQGPPTVTARRPASKEDLPPIPFRPSVGVQTNLPSAPMAVNFSSPKIQQSGSQPRNSHKPSNNLPVSPMVAAKSRYDIHEPSSTEIFLLGTDTQSDGSLPEAKAIKDTSSASWKSTVDTSLMIFFVALVYSLA